MGKEKMRLKAKFTLLIVVLLIAGCASGIKQQKPLVWPEPPEKPRIQYLTSIYGGNVFKKSLLSKLIDIILGEESTNYFLKPYGVTTDEIGNMYVTDTGHRLVFVFDVRRKKLRFIGAKGRGRLGVPIGITTDETGNIYVTDVALKSIMVYRRDGKFKMKITNKNLKNPAGIAYDRKTKRLYVVDSKSHKVLVFDKSGKFLFSFGGRGKENGKFNYPTNIFVKNGKVYVVDTMNFRVQIFTSDGRFITSFGSLGDRPGQFARPKGIAVDSEGHIYVADAAFDNFQIFDENGNILLFVGGPGTKPGKFNLPAGMWIDKNDRIYVVDQLNRRVQVFKFIKTR